MPALVSDHGKVIPIVAALDLAVETQFEGVIGTGKILSENQFSEETDIIHLFDHSYHFWRGNLEMAQGNQIIPLSKMLAYTASGQLDIVMNYLKIIGHFSEKGNAAHFLLTDLSWHMQKFSEALAQEIQKGIQLHDQGKIADAIAIYEGILDAYPHSAWAQYELFLSQRQENEALNPWEQAQTSIYKADPLYDMSGQLSSGKDSYKYFQRQEIGKLFREEDKFAEDVLHLGDIALDLEDYGFAAHVYWLGMMLKSEGDDQMEYCMTHFLYAQDKLGNDDVIGIFDKDYSKTFKKIDKDRKKQMESHAAFQAFKKKE